MDILDPTCFPLDDTLFDFTLDGEDDVNLKETVSVGGAASVSSPLSNSNATTPFGTVTQSGLFPEEEELEWISNKDAFPSLSTCFKMLPENPELILNYHSPDSVLENNNGSNSNINANSNGCVMISSSDSVQVPTSYPVGARTMKGRKKRTEFSHLPSQKEVVPMKTAPKNPRDKLDVNGIPRKCLHCQSDKTPQWRSGPMGPKTLCNACGVRYKSGRLWPEYRPANSPTFSIENHSNSHKKVIKMRKEKYVGVGPVFGELVVVPNNAD